MQTDGQTLLLLLSSLSLILLMKLMTR